VRFFCGLSLAVFLAGLAVTLGGGAASARSTVHPAEPSVAELRVVADHYRSLTWTYERAALARTTPTSFSYRHSASRTYLRWTIGVWTHRAYRAHVQALRGIRHRLRVRLPKAAPLHASLSRRLTSERKLALKLERIYPGHAPRRTRTIAVGSAARALLLWQSREAAAALRVASHAHPALPGTLIRAFGCIHSYEGAWTSNTGNGYYGGLQMDLSFQRLYGAEYLRRWGTADNWPSWAQLTAAVAAYRSGRGFWPWPNSARVCGLI
jgi:hypothetical protein